MPPPSQDPPASHGARLESQVCARSPCAPWAHLVSRGRTPFQKGPPCAPRRSVEAVGQLLRQHPPWEAGSHDIGCGALTQCDGNPRERGPLTTTMGGCTRHVDSGTSSSSPSAAVGCLSRQAAGSEAIVPVTWSCRLLRGLKIGLSKQSILRIQNQCYFTRSLAKIF